MQQQYEGGPYSVFIEPDPSGNIDWSRVPAYNEDGTPYEMPKDENALQEAWNLANKAPKWAIAWGTRRISRRNG